MTLSGQLLQGDVRPLERVVAAASLGLGGHEANVGLRAHGGSSKAVLMAPTRVLGVVPNLLRALSSAAAASEGALSCGRVAFVLMPHTFRGRP